MADEAYNLILNRLEGKGCDPVERGRGLTALCPAHEDSRPSLSVDRGEDRALVICRTGCDTADILDALDLQPPDLFDDQQTGKPWTNDGLRATGTNLGSDGRWGVGAGRYKQGDRDKMLAEPGVERDLWPDPTTQPGDTLYVVEGEPDAITSISLGLPCVAAPGAGKKWTEDWGRRIAEGRKRVVVLLDSDKHGRRKAPEWAGFIALHCPDVRVLELFPGRNDGSDLSDFASELRADGNLDQFATSIRAMAQQNAIRVQPALKPPASETGGVQIDFPSNLDVELAVIGTALSSRQNAEMLREQLSVSEELFFSEVNKGAWRAVAGSSGSTDVLTLGAAIDRNPEWMPRGVGKDHVVEAMTKALATTVESSITDHVELLRDMSARRKLIQAAIATVADAQRKDMDPGLALANAERALLAADTSMARRSVLTFRDTGRQTLKGIQGARAAAAAGGAGQVYFGLKAFDNHLRGMKPAELVFLAGAPGTGKTAVAIRMALNYAQSQLKLPKEQRVGTLFVSLEMGVQGMGERITQMVAPVSGDILRTGNMTDYEYQQAVDGWKAHDAGGELPLYLLNPAKMTASQLAADIARAVRQHNVGVVFIDHFRRFHLDKRSSDGNREDEEKVLFLEEEICKQMDLAVICLAHTRKLGGEEENRRPTLNDLRGSGQINASADAVVFLHRPFRAAIAKGEEVSLDERCAIEAIYGKNRSGPEGSTSFFFDGEKMSIRDA